MARDYQTAPLTFSILIPAHNEEQAVGACIASCLAQTRPADQVIVVNDGSTDGTADVLKSFGRRIEVVAIPTATGNKSHAQEAGLRRITSEVVVVTDADTLMEEHFLEYVEAAYAADPSVIAVCGYVKSLRYNWLTACRELEYFFNQQIFKRAQAYLDAIYVIPGCAGAFKKRLFKDIMRFDHDTLTEDLDLTYKLHRSSRRIAYVPRAVVYTQDPSTLSSYINQTRRWYSGAWQNLRKHRQIINKPNNSFLLSLMYIEGLVLSVFLYIVPVLNPKFFIVGLGLFTLYNCALGLVAGCFRRRADLFFYAPFVTFLVYLNALIFLEQFWKEIVLGQTNLEWFHPERRAI